MTINVEYIHHCGTDLTVANAARVSFDKKSGYNVVSGKKYLREGDAKLINYLAKHKHFSPFNHCFVTFRVTAPVFVARQLVKHEYMPWNEVSRRYVDSDPEFYSPPVWRERAPDKKQGSKDTGLNVVKSAWVSGVMRAAESAAIKAYNLALFLGVAPEQARAILPQSMYTEWYWSGTLKAFAKMCSLRCKPDAQYETKLVADLISEKMGELFPVSWAALKEAEL